MRLGQVLSEDHPCLGAVGTENVVQSAQVLIVDDEADVIEALKLRLSTAGFRTITASDGAEALDLLRHKNVDLILSDLMMPNLDGLELARRIHQDPKLRGIRILLFSCHNDPVTEDLALEFGALGYVPKAIGAPAIVSRVREILGAVRSSDASSPVVEPSYERAERDLIIQLRALSETAGATENRRASRAETSESAPRRRNRQDPKGDQLLHLAKGLEIGSKTKH